MRTFKAALLAATLSIPALAGAVQLAGPGPGGVPPGNSAQLVERGGTVMQVDMGKRLVVIDGVPWTLTPSTRIVFPAPKKGALQAVELRPGDQVKLSTRRSGADEDVVEILVVGRDGRFDRH